MPVKIAARPPRRRPCPGRRPDPGPKNCNASPRYFISRANDFSEHRRRVERPAHAARRTLAVTHAIVSNEPRGPCSLPPSAYRSALRRCARRPRFTGALARIRPSDWPPRSAREQGRRPAGSSRIDPMAGLPSRKGNIPAPALRAHSHRSTGHRHSGSPTSIMPGQSAIFAIPDKQASAVYSPWVASVRHSGFSPARIPGCAVAVGGDAQGHGTGQPAGLYALAPARAVSSEPP